MAGRHRAHGAQAGCGHCDTNPLLRMDIRRAVIDQLGGLDFVWPRPVQHLQVGDLPLHLPVLVQAYADQIDLPWVALHAGRVLGVTGHRLTPKHRAPLREVYRLAPTTKLALEFYVEDRVLEGFWANRQSIIASLSGLGFDLILSPSYSVWYDHSRFEQLVQQRRAAPGRRLMMCNGMAYARAQRRRRLGGEDRTIAWSARDYFLHNCAYNERTYAEILNDMDARVAV